MFLGLSCQTYWQNEGSHYPPYSFLGKVRRLPPIGFDRLTVLVVALSVGECNDDARIGPLRDPRSASTSNSGMECACVTYVTLLLAPEFDVPGKGEFSQGRDQLDRVRQSSDQPTAWSEMTIGQF